MVDSLLSLMKVSGGIRPLQEELGGAEVGKCKGQTINQGGAIDHAKLNHKHPLFYLPG